MQGTIPRHVYTCPSKSARMNREMRRGWNVCKRIFARNNWKTRWHASSASPTFRSFINSNSYVRPNVTVAQPDCVLEGCRSNCCCPFLSASPLFPASKLTSGQGEDGSHQPPKSLRDIDRKDARGIKKKRREMKRIREWNCDNIERKSKFMVYSIIKKLLLNLNHNSQKLIFKN